MSRENLHDEPQLRAALDSRFGARARLIDGLAAVSVVGAGINATYANVRAGSALLAENGHRARDDRDVVFSDHLDGAAGPHDRGRAGAPPPLHRVATAAGALTCRR